MVSMLLRAPWLALVCLVISVGCTTEKPTCTATCDAEGAQSCLGGQLSVCQADADGCLGWVQSLCSFGTCASATTCAGCVDGCTAGSTVCEGGAQRTCTRNDQGCLQPGPATACSSGACADATHCATCQNECTAGAVRCQAGATSSCEVGADGCSHWSATATCASGFCGSATTCGQCQNSCATAGATACAGGEVRTCVADANGCRAWGATTACASGSCASATACSACVDGCSVPGASSCSGGQLQQCATGADGCLAWGTATACATGVCGGTAACDVAPSASLHCPTSVKVGVGASFDGSASADPDGQLTTWAFDFGDGSAVVTGASATASHTFTQAGSYTVSLTVTDAQQVTAQASCAVQVKPASLVISELLYRNAGADTGTFIELKGPAGQSLQGYSLVAVNGADGADYATLALSGSIPARGYYLVVHPSAPAALVALADLTSTKVDLQNGPDSLQLRQGTTVVDAVGYGTFTATDTFAGEGRAVADTGDDKSLSRDAQGDDTDDNLTDFHVSARPSPGQPDGANAAPVAKLTCPSTASVGVAAAFDGAGSTDVDGTVVTWAFAFGDGTAGQSGAQSQASHAFAQAGTFTVGLTVTDDQGGTGQVSCTVVVSSAPPQLTSLTVSPATASVAKGLTQAFTATGHYSDGSTKDLSASVTWGSTDATVATVSTAGLASAQATGSTTVTAQSGSLSASATLTVTAPVVTGVTVTPGTPSVLVGKTLPLVATATSSDGSSADVTAQATWSSASTSVATVTAGGVALGAERRHREGDGQLRRAEREGDVDGDGALVALVDQLHLHVR